MTRYELLDRIGVGGMAEIFRGKAVAAGGFEKPVAIKRILPHLSQDTRFVELLIAEAKVLSLLKHRNIVQIFDVGLGDDGKYFLVMEYVDGRDLGAVQRSTEVRRRRIPFDLALHVGAEVCEALEHAHSARAPDGKPMSLVHRDVSPSNVLLSRAGEVKLTDFGIAKRAEQETTGHGAVRGKFAYISPEQARNEHLEPRSDVFSVGILLWELVTGRRLFSGLGDLEALRAVREPQVPRPRDFDTRLTPEIDALIMSALAPEPRVRPTAGQLGAKLRSLRYSLEVTVGDPATELAKIIDAAEEALSQAAPPAEPPRGEFEGSEATVIRIHTADAFSMRDKDGAGMARAREVIDRFEEEETRQAKLSRDQMAFLRATAQRDSGELSSAVEPPLPGVRPRRSSDEPTRAHAPMSTEDVATLYPDPPGSSQSFDGDEATRLLPPSGRPTPERLAPERLAPERLAPERLAPERLAPERLAPERMTPPRSPTQPPPLPGAPPAGRMRPPTGPPPQTPPPGTVHDRSGRGAAPGLGSHPAPPMAVTPVMMQPPPLGPPPAMPPGMPPAGSPLGPPPLGPPPMMPPSPSQSAGPPLGPLPLGPPPMMPPPMMPPPPSQSAGPPLGPLPLGPSPMMMPPLGPPPIQPPGAGPGPMMPPQGGYAPWGRPPVGASPGVQAMYDRQPPQRPSTPGRRRGSRRTPLQPWMLVIGALIMALLAFAVTRACIHTATSRPPAVSK